jgi:hypothetical protein
MSDIQTSVWKENKSLVHLHYRYIVLNSKWAILKQVCERKAKVCWIYIIDIISDY